MEDEITLDDDEGKSSILESAVVLFAVILMAMIIALREGWFLILFIAASIFVF